MNEKINTEEQQPDEIQETLQWMLELRQRANDISEAMKQGQTGYGELKNFISDLPMNWVNDIRDQINKALEKGDKEAMEIKQAWRLGKITSRQKMEGMREVRQDAVREGKSIVIEKLRKEHVLYNTRKVPETAVYSELIGEMDEQ